MAIGLVSKVSNKRKIFEENCKGKIDLTTKKVSNKFSFFLILVVVVNVVVTFLVMIIVINEVVWMHSHGFQIIFIHICQTQKKALHDSWKNSAFIKHYEKDILINRPKSGQID